MTGRPPLPPPAKGSVTPLSSVFPAEEAQKASQRVNHTLTEAQSQLDTLRGFISDNSALINLVKRLPDELSYPIMVPFGPAAFFPGKIIHTNELTVLLGEGHYAERTAKQTVDILKRRGKGLELQVEGVKAVMDDLKVEASFFNATANEAAEGIVEIREDYFEGTSPSKEFAPSIPKSESVNIKTNKASDANEDDEYNRILSRLEELEKEEKEAEEANETEEEEENDSNEDVHLNWSQHTTIKARSEAEGPPQKPHVPKDGSAHNQGLAVTPLKSMDNSLKAPAVKEKLDNTQKEEIPKESNHPGITNNKEIIGSIVERVHTKPIEEPSGGRSSRPVSRFRQQRK